MPNVKQISIKQPDGTYKTEEIGVEHTNVDGLSSYVYDIKRDTTDPNIFEIDKGYAGEPTPTSSSTIDLTMNGATNTNPGTVGLVPQPAAGDENKFLRGDGTWDNYKGDGSDIDIDSNNQISLINTPVTPDIYGPSADVTGSNGATIVIPKFEVDANGRLVSAGEQTYTSVDTQYSAGSGISIATGNKITLGSHAVSAVGTYGGGTTSLYGHVKLSDTYKTQESGATAANSVGASQNAVYNVYNQLKTSVNQIASAFTLRSQKGTANLVAVTLKSCGPILVPLAFTIPKSTSFTCSLPNTDNSYYYAPISTFTLANTKSLLTPFNINLDDYNASTNPNGMKVGTLITIGVMLTSAGATFGNLYLIKTSSGFSLVTNGIYRSTTKNATGTTPTTATALYPYFNSFGYSLKITTL